MNEAGLTLRTLDGPAATAAVSALANVLLDCVARGASVGFMAPLGRPRAEAFWSGVAEGVARGDRRLIVALIGETIVGTVQVMFAGPDNQPHRADVAKMLVHGDYRRRGIGEALMAAAEEAARDAGRTVLVLDTASDAAERLYTRAGWTRLGVIPDYALLPRGGFCDTVLFYTRLEPGAFRRNSPKR